MIKFIVNRLPIEQVKSAGLEALPALFSVLDASGEPTGNMLLVGHGTEDGLSGDMLHAVNVAREVTTGIVFVACCHPRIVRDKEIWLQSKSHFQRAEHVQFVGNWGQETGFGWEERDESTATACFFPRR